MSDKIRKDSNISKQQRMVIDIIHTANWLDARITRILKKYGITHPQFNILKNVQAAHPEPLSVKEIRDTIMFTNSDITRLIDRLVNKELLHRETCSVNRRKVEICITNRATQMLDIISKELLDTFSDFYESQISVEEALHISEILRLIRRSS